MKCRRAVTISLLAGLLAGVMAGDVAEDIRRDLEYRTVIFPRQSEPLDPNRDLQRFKGNSLGGLEPGQITLNPEDKQQPFKATGTKDGSPTEENVSDFQAAAEKVCGYQKNACSDFVNDKKGAAGFEVGDCDKQQEDCRKANEPDKNEQDDEFDFFCDD